MSVPTLSSEAPKRSKFDVSGRITSKFKTRFLTINFNNAGFVKEAGYDDNDFSRRVDLLANFLKTMVKQYHVSLINIQEISSRYMNAEEFRFKILSKLFEVSTSWTGTFPVGRHGNFTKCLNLMTFWNADILHLNSLHNLHFSKSDDMRTVGDDLCNDKEIFATSNAIVMDMSFSVPQMTDEYHTQGMSIDNSAKILNLNVHMPLRGCLKLKCMKKILLELERYPKIDEYFVSMSGDMNLFFDEDEHIEILKVMKEIGSFHAMEHGETYLLDTLFGSTRSTTFIGMLYDLQKNMKMSINRETFEIWVRGNSKEIFEKLDRKVGPLDWFVFRNKDWCKSIDTKVIDINDMINLGFSEDYPPIESESLPDYGNRLTDHLPLIATIEFSR